MPEKEEYDYGSNRQDGATVAGWASVQRDANSLRAEATADLAKELGTAPRLSRDLPGNAPAVGSAEPARGSGDQAHADQQWGATAPVA